MGAIINKLLKKEKPILPENLKSGVILYVFLKDGDKEDLESLASKYDDMNILWSNMTYLDENKKEQ